MSKHKDNLGGLIQRLTHKQSQWQLSAEEYGVLCRALALRCEGATLTAGECVAGFSDTARGVAVLSGLIGKGLLSCGAPLDGPERLLSCDPIYATLSKPDDVEISEEKFPLSTLIRATMHMMKQTPSGESKVTARHWARVSEFSKRAESDYSGNDLELLIAVYWVQNGWASQPPVFTAKDYSNAKRFVSLYGAEQSAKIIAYAVSRWEVVAQKIRVNSYPSMSIIYGFRNSIAPLVLDGDAVEKPSWGSQFNPQTDSRKDDGIVGW